MKATDFNLSHDIKYDLGNGLTTFHNTRLVIFDSNAIGLLRQSIIEALGWEKARALFLRFGYQHGYSDVMQLKVNYQFDTDADLLAAGPVIHTWEGIVQASARHLHVDRAKGECVFSGVWTNSYEAEQHLSFNDPGEEPVCWSLSGYATGYSTGWFGAPLMAVEPMCVGKGDDHYEWLIRPPGDFGPETTAYVQVFQEFWRKLGR